MLHFFTSFGVNIIYKEMFVTGRKHEDVIVNNIFTISNHLQLNGLPIFSIVAPPVNTSAVSNKWCVIHHVQNYCFFEKCIQFHMPWLVHFRPGILLLQGYHVWPLVNVFFFFFTMPCDQPSNFRRGLFKKKYIK